LPTAKGKELPRDANIPATHPSLRSEEQKPLLREEWGIHSLGAATC